MIHLNFSSQKFVWSIGAITLGMGVLLLGNAVSEGAPRVKPGTPKSATNRMPESQQASNRQLHQALQVLRSVHHTLQQADHDYGGHRVAAVKDIHQAEKQLREALQAVQQKHPQHGTGKNPTGKPNGQGGNKNTNPQEPQALSDQQLRESIPVLNETIAFLNKADHDYGGHRAKAVTDLQAAVKQLEAALKFSQQKNAKN